MNKFWKWMVEKDYAPHYRNFKYLYDEVGVVITPTKQMLIGYMIEYLYCRSENNINIFTGILDIEVDIENGKANIDDIYKQLEKEIEKIVTE